MSEKPGRHQTSMGAMVGAMTVLVVILVAFVLLRDLNRQSAENEPEALDWQTAVVAAQEAGFAVVHPAALPAGWKVTSLDFTATDPPTWSMGMLTDTGAFVGLRQEDDSVDRLLETFVDEDPSEGDDVRIEGDLAGEWQTWSDEGGDVALVRQREDDVVLVYGSASQAVAEKFATQLTESALTPVEPSQQPSP